MITSANLTKLAVATIVGFTLLGFCVDGLLKVGGL